MRVRQRIVIACNKCGIEFEASENAKTMAEARVEARKEGWSSSGSTIDRCPDDAGPRAENPKVKKIHQERRKKSILASRNAVVVQLAGAGHEPAQIADAIGVSRQRVYQILEEK